MIFEHCKSREKCILNIDVLLANLMKVKKMDKRINFVTSSKTEAYNTNWCITYNILPVT